MGKHRKRARPTPSPAAVRPEGNAGGGRRGWGVFAVATVILVLAVAVLAPKWRTDRGPQRLDLSPSAVPAVRVNRPGSGAAEESRSGSLLTEANEQLAKGNVQAAIDLLHQALQLTPRNEDLHFNLGIAYGRAGSVTNAEHEYLEALAILPDYPEAHNNLGNMLLHQERLAEAEAHLTEAIKILPEYASAFNSLGILRQRQHRPKEALEYFEKAVRYKSDYWQAKFNLANSYANAGETEKAVAELRGTLRLNPSFEAARQALDKLLGPPSPLAPPN